MYFPWGKIFSKEAPSSFKKVNPYWAHSTGSPVKPLRMGTSRSPGSLFSRFLAMLSACLTQTQGRTRGENGGGKIRKKRQ